METKTDTHISRNYLGWKLIRICRHLLSQLNNISYIKIMHHELPVINGMNDTNYVFKLYIITIYFITNDEKSIQTSESSNKNNLDILCIKSDINNEENIDNDNINNDNKDDNNLDNNDNDTSNENNIDVIINKNISDGNDNDIIIDFNNEIDKSNDVNNNDIPMNNNNYKTDIENDFNNDKTTSNHSTATEITLPTATVPLESIEPISEPDTDNQNDISTNQTLSLADQFKSYVPNINSQQGIDDELGMALSYQYMFDKRTSPWEMKDWDQDELNTFVIQVEKIDRLYHMVADEEDPNLRSWEICCRMEYKGEKYFVEMYANCDYTGFDCQGGGLVSITKLPDFFLSNMVSNDQNSDQIYKALLEDGYKVQEPDPLHKMHPKFWNNSPMLKFLCHNAIYKNRNVLSHYKEELPQILANSVEDFIKVKDWENE